VNGERVERRWALEVAEDAWRAEDRGGGEVLDVQVAVEVEVMSR